MSSKRAAIAVTVGIVLGIIFKAPVNETKSEGTIHKSIENIRKNFDEVLYHEREGVALAVYQKGELIADLWGGYADRSADRLWERDTMSVAFSSTKTIGALIVAILVSRGQLQYEDLVTKHWPEFGQNGKENVTVQWIVEHKAGLITFDGEIPLKDGNNHEYISKLIEKTKPAWPAGTASGYHALTYGWIIDQIVRRADPKKRGVGEFYRQEIQSLMKDKDFYVGLPNSLQSRVARLEQPTTTEFIKAVVLNPFYLTFLLRSFLSGASLMHISGDYPSWMTVMRWEIPYNNPKVREVENIAAIGVGTARGLASVVSAVMQSDLISEDVWKRISKPTMTDADIVVHKDMPRGYGLFHEKHPTRKNSYLLAHMGHGMQKVVFDPETKTSVAVMRNLLSFDYRVQEATDKIVELVIRQTDKQ